MSLGEIVSVSISTETQFPTRAGFGRMLLAGYHTVFPERTRVYTKPSEMVADGFLQTDPLVRLATILMSQSPKSKDFKIGRLANAYSQQFRITPTDTTEGVVTALDIVSPNGTVTSVTRTNGASETVATICAALQALINAISGLTATDNTTHITCAADNSGELFDVKNRTGGLSLLDETADPGIAADLAAIRLADPDWYGLGLDSSSKAQVAAAAAWAEAETVLYAARTADDEMVAKTAGNIFETLNAAAYARTHGWYHPNLLSGLEIGITGVAFPQDAGSLTWKFKTVAGVPVYSLTATQRSNIRSYNGNFYQLVAGKNITCDGKAFDGDFIDVQRTIDEMSARVQEDVAGALFSKPKLPYTDGSVSMVKGIIRAVIGRFIARNAVASDPEPLVTAPLVADVAVADRAARILPDVTFQATLAGAIHKVEVQGTLSV